MKKIQIQTAYHVPIEYYLATVGDRFLAKLIDIFIQIAFVIVSTLMWSKLFTIYTLLGNLFFTFVFLYPLWIEIIFKGQSLGKMIMNIQVIKADGTVLNFFDYLTRFVFLIGDMFTLGALAILMISLSEMNQRIGDILADSVVTKRIAHTNLNKTAFVKTESNYQVQYPNVLRLKDSDIVIIKKVIANVESDFSNKYNAMLIRKTCNKIAEILEMDTSDKSIDFLKIVIKDYNFVSGKE